MLGSSMELLVVRTAGVLTRRDVFCVTLDANTETTSHAADGWRASRHSTTTSGTAANSSSRATTHASTTSMHLSWTVSATDLIVVVSLHF